MVNIERLSLHLMLLTFILVLVFSICVLYLVYQTLNILFSVVTLRHYNMNLWTCSAQLLLTRYNYIQLYNFVKHFVEQIKLTTFFGRSNCKKL